MDKSERTPLHTAAERNHTAAVKILLENNADMRLKEKRLNAPPIHLAILSDNYEYGYLHL